MTAKEIKKKIDNLANKLNKRIASFSKLEQMIPEVKHVYNLLSDSIMSKFVKNGKFKRGVSGLPLDEQIEYLDQLEQQEHIIPTKSEAEKIIEDMKESLKNNGYEDLDEESLFNIGNVWGYITNNIPDWTYYFSSEDLNEALTYVVDNQDKETVKQKLEQIKNIIDEDNKNEIKHTRFKIFDILYEEQDRY